MYVLEIAFARKYVKSDFRWNLHYDPRIMRTPKRVREVTIFYGLNHLILNLCSTIMYCYSYFSKYLLSLQSFGLPKLYYLIMFDLGIRLPFRHLSSLHEKISNAELISSLAQHTFTGFFS